MSATEPPDPKPLDLAHTIRLICVCLRVREGEAPFDWGKGADLVADAARMLMGLCYRLGDEAADLILQQGVRGEHSLACFFALLGRAGVLGTVDHRDNVVRYLLAGLCSCVAADLPDPDRAARRVLERAVRKAGEGRVPVSFADVKDHLPQRLEQVADWLTWAAPAIDEETGKVYPRETVSLELARTVATPNALLREGDFWRVRFNGVERLFENVEGFPTLGLLLRAPGKKFSARDMISDGSRASVASVAPTGPHDPEPEELGLDKEERYAMQLEGAHLGETLDKEYRNDLEAEIKRARDAGEIDKAVPLEKHLRRSRDHRGRPRNEGTSPLEKARRLVRSRFKPILDGIKRRGPPGLHEHFDKYLHVGNELHYDVPDQRAWLVRL